jgi:diguanylate cyclase (GGDEF)-like protein/PAS domain S-box-containing protein
VETANDVIIITTPQLDPPGPKIVYVNPAFTRLTGYSAEEAIGATPRILQGPGTSRATLDSIGAALREGRLVREKVLNFAKCGAPYWLDLHIGALRDAGGTITHFAAIQRDVTMDKRRLDELEFIADRDTLTGIPNRRAFLRAVESEIETASRSNAEEFVVKGPCLALIDVDHFKLVNDELGHAVGDAVLFGIADRLTENIRRMDTLGRIGGEEFAVCMPSVTLRDARALAERLRCAVADTPMETALGPVPVTVSIGVAAYKGGDSVLNLMDRADAAMYAAKRGGRDRVRASTSTK